MLNLRNLLSASFVAIQSTTLLSAADQPAPQATLRQYCFQCHGKAASGGINLEQLTAARSVGEHFQQWRKVASVLEEGRMPPPNAPQPAAQDRQKAARWIRTNLNEHAQKHAGDPGRVTMRRLTSAEYAYTIQDLTGLDLKLDREFAGDSVGGEGFTNFGDVQFMGDANLERYLRTAKLVADHAVIGSGPIQFFRDPGKSGMELSAIHRIQDIYTTHGFRATSAEGGRPYGLQRYSQAFYAAWRYHHRDALGERNATLESLGAKQGLSPRFVQHIWSVLHQPTNAYPTSEVIARWNRLPVPTVASREQSAKAALSGCDEIKRFLIDWPRSLFGAGALAEGGQGDERALVLTEESIQASRSQKLRAGARVRGEKLRMYLSTASMNPNSKDMPVVIWKDARVSSGRPGRDGAGQKPLRAVLDEETVKRLGFGKHPAGAEIGPNDFATVGDGSISLDIPVPPGSGFLGLSVEAGVEAMIGASQSGDAVLRVTVSDQPELSQGRPSSALLGNPESAGYKAWKSGVLDFAVKLPQVSQGEPTPSDRDPIPPPVRHHVQPARAGLVPHQGQILSQ